MWVDVLDLGISANWALVAKVCLRRSRKVTHSTLTSNTIILASHMYISTQMLSCLMESTFNSHKLFKTSVVYWIGGGFEGKLNLQRVCSQLTLIESALCVQHAQSGVALGVGSTLASRHNHHATKFYMPAHSYRCLPSRVQHAHFWSGSRGRFNSYISIWSSCGRDHALILRVRV